MKRLYFGTNLKMYKNGQETASFLRELQEKTADLSREEIELFVIPSYTSLQSAVHAADKHIIKLGAQNMCWAEQGQFTGEISPIMLQELGLELVMIGHSERRHVFGERDEDENRKVLCSIDHGFTTLLCIGETECQKEYGISDEVLRTQLKIGLHGITQERAALLASQDKLWVAYEPVWAIGTGGKPASAEYANEKHLVIKSCLRELFGKAADNIPVLYGGSVNQENATKLIVQPEIDGLFVGRSAWSAASFDALIRESIRAFHSAKDSTP